MGSTAMTTPVITLDAVSKRYRSYARDIDRVMEIFTGNPRHQEYEALRPLSLQVAPGEVIGVIGKNGAGKSTLLKILAGTLQATSGTVNINGRVSAILELGASFHPEMSGHDNIYLTCAIQGLSRKETDAAYAAITGFAGIGEFLARPVKTYSSGMLMRVAFAIATHVNPDILIVDEALSVGDGVFARRSFDRIMEFRSAGKTIFFCSHSLYQVEALCDRVLWLEQGQLRSVGEPARVITQYSEFLQQEAGAAKALMKQTPEKALPVAAEVADASVPKVLDVSVRVDGQAARVHTVQSGRSNVEITVDFRAPPALPVPSVGVIFFSGDGREVASAGTLNDGVHLQRNSSDTGRVSVTFPQLPLLKGNYFLDVYLLCEQGLLIYEHLRQVAEFNVEQRGLELGVVSLPHQWTPQ